MQMWVAMCDEVHGQIKLSVFAHSRSYVYMHEICSDGVTACSQTSTSVNRRIPHLKSNVFHVDLLPSELMWYDRMIRFDPAVEVKGGALIGVWQNPMGRVATKVEQSSYELSKTATSLWAVPSSDV